MGIFLLITIFKTQAQTNTTWQIKAIEPYHVAVTFSKTTNIIFPYSIISVDIGSQDVLAQKAKGVENILQIKAAKERFPQTNISVVTADGKLTSFLVDYAEQPSVLNLSLVREKKKIQPASYQKRLTRQKYRNMQNSLRYRRKKSGVSRIKDLVFV